jgi:hypothetical protein
MRKQFLVVLMAIILMTCGVAFGQTSSGEIRGRVADTADAVIVGARVTLTNQSTHEKRSATTNSQGEFVFVALQPGNYSVLAESTGFKTFEKRDMVLSASDRLSAGTLLLRPGSV